MNHSRRVMVFIMKGKQINAYVLAGGQSRRLGRDKLFLEIGGTKLLTRTIATCQAVFDTVKIVAKCEQRFLDFGCEVLLDQPGPDGPLAGVLAALEDSPTSCCFITAADLYDLNVQAIVSLLANYRGEQYLGFQEPGGIQPLCGLYTKSALQHLKESAKNGDLKMSHAISRLGCRFLPLAQRPWRNLNCTADLQSIEGYHG